MVRFTFKTTNNKVEYEALVVEVSMAKVLGAIKVEVKVDSKVVVNQVLGVYAVKGKKLKYLQLTWVRQDKFCHFNIKAQ